MIPPEIEGIPTDVIEQPKMDPFLPGVPEEQFPEIISDNREREAKPWLEESVLDPNDYLADWPFWVRLGPSYKRVIPRVVR